MNIQNIYTDRFFQNWPSWDLVYEWEDVFKDHLNLKLTDSRKAAIVTKFIDRTLSSLSRRLNLRDNELLKIADKSTVKPTSLYFEMFPQNSFGFSASKHTIPYIIDFWKTQDLEAFYRVYKNCKLILISSKETFDFLKENDCKLNIAHLPLSISNKYKTAPTHTVNKKYDIILAGRTPAIFFEYLKKYEKKNPEIEYLRAKHTGNQLCFESNKTGLIGNFQKREDYINLLKQTKVAFYSTPGIDGGEERTGGFNPVTPRLFEMVAAGCAIIARYPQNSDTSYFRLKEFYPSADDYSGFEDQLNILLEKNPRQIKAHNERFLGPHYTSKRVGLLDQILKLQVV